MSTSQRLPGIFLTGAWRWLVMLNFEVDSKVLESRVPRGCLLDQHDGKVFVSLVGFLFAKPESLESQFLGMLPLKKSICGSTFAEKSEMKSVAALSSSVKSSLAEPSPSWPSGLTTNPTSHCRCGTRCRKRPTKPVRHPRSLTNGYGAANGMNSISHPRAWEHFQRPALTKNSSPNTISATPYKRTVRRLSIASNIRLGGNGPPARPRTMLTSLPFTVKNSHPLSKANRIAHFLRKVRQS